MSVNGRSVTETRREIPRFNPFENLCRFLHVTDHAEYEAISSCLCFFRYVRGGCVGLEKFFPQGNDGLHTYRILG